MEESALHTCYSVGAGDFTPRGLTPAAEDLLIAADGGYRALRQYGFTPQLLLGDFESMPESEAAPGTCVLCFPVQKDDTDTGLALREGWRRGYRSFALYGCGGGRVDHLLANLQTMGFYARQGASIRLADPEYDAFALHNGQLTLPDRPAGTLVSVFCHGSRADGVTLKGLKYPLENGSLTCDFPLGVSNHYTGVQATVSVKDGTLLILSYVSRQ